MNTIKCKVCDTGMLLHKRKYRMSGIVVLIGYILLVPSVIGILIAAAGVVGVGFSSSAFMHRDRATVQGQLQRAGVPTSVLTKVIASKSLAVADTARLGSRQRTAIRNAQAALTDSSAETAIAGGLFVVFGIASLVGGLLGWVLVMKKAVLQCNVCDATIAAS